MHDPATVAFEIKSPFSRQVGPLANGKTWRYWPPLITIWHVDPEEDGSDDGCGWSHYRLTEAEREWCRKLGDDEFKFWMGEYGRSASGGMAWTAQDIIFWAWRIIATRRGRDRRPLSVAELDRIECLATNPHDNLRRIVVECGSEQGMRDLFLCVYRLYRTHHRPWYRHPRFHVHHWRIQWHFQQRLRRWLFTRCAHCGKRFAWNESPISFQWDPGPTCWFRGTPGLYHQGCSGLQLKQDDTQPTPVPPTPPSRPAGASIH